MPAPGVPELPPQARGRRQHARGQHPESGATPAGAGTTASPATPRGCATSYPRRRGDDDVPSVVCQTTTELPPQARGRRRRGDRLVAEAGATPAGAGTTPGGRRRPCPGSYPRRRGDDPGQADGVRLERELPPQARGRRVEPHRVAALAGATPAGAGTTSLPISVPPLRTSYPRRRGDDSRGAGTSWRRRELPPQARGRRGADARVHRGQRATPAGAGTTRPRPGRRRPGRSYPRRRGDDTATSRFSSAYTELPPQARGRQPAAGLLGGLLRATPAGAGTTPWPPASRTRSDELPPQARGRLPRPARAAVHGGATPAGAGTTHCRHTDDNTRGSYPRRRGDDPPGWVYHGNSPELPPQARGRPRQFGGQGWPVGATPAGAGTTGGTSSCRLASGSYPRRRGDDPARHRPGPANTELPPQARGRRIMAALRSRGGGATPAGAGTTAQAPAPCRPASSYPRRRGDDGRYAVPGAAGRGATPAGAGTTVQGQGQGTAGRSYPRRRGDDTS